MSLKLPIEAIFFDLDGTLLDTAEDLAIACNQTLNAHQKKSISPSEFRQWIHGGAAMMIANSFNIDKTHPDFATLIQEFLQNYQKTLTQKTQFYEGMETILRHIEKQKIPWGVVTNKITRLARPILDHFQLTHRCCSIVYGDSLAKTKPNPEPLLLACQMANVNSLNCVYVGDTFGDVQAALSAGMQSIVAQYGYAPKDSLINEWPATAMVSNPKQLYMLLSRV